MTSGVQSSNQKMRRWTANKRTDGFQRITIWASPELDAQISHYAFNMMVPKSVAVEMIVKEYLKEKV